jgi:hypothetical protein
MPSAAITERPLKRMRGLMGAVVGDLRQGGNPTSNPIKRTLSNASPAGPNQGITVYNTTPQNPLANAMAPMALAKANPNAFANGPIKMNSSNKTGRVIS